MVIQRYLTDKLQRILLFKTYLWLNESFPDHLYKDNLNKKKE